jgi:hypothetical protein
MTYRKQSGRQYSEKSHKPHEKPIIGHSGWQGTISPEQVKRIRIERRKQIEQSPGTKITEATDYEALVYVSTASFAAPLDSTYAKIMMYLFQKYYPEQTVIPEKVTLGNCEEHHLKRLKEWLNKAATKK